MRPFEVALKVEGIREAVNLGTSEASYLGSEFVGITLDNGMGIILRISPDEEIRNVLVMSKEPLPLNPLGAFIRSDGTVYYIYIENEMEKINQVLGENRRAVFVEVISGDLEDFLREGFR
ncbi:hypothetical protein GWK48_02325 [Metallosphaera tengchongensis]|uniref:Uncharacterized protein n=1 Tax=Metallosphaera tengchongensis TaxID=1532350 RepID=A0A6N0NU06_9CREN|nr:hypothetical protein [Metallosphaera tengchongensis]QKQ99382.1 hypothetical protein GWK48_02325 [Metallosphaera tengchongensis]